VRFWVCAPQASIRSPPACSDCIQEDFSTAFNNPAADNLDLNPGENFVFQDQDF